MANKFKGILSGAGFYAALGICLTAAAVAGWFLLLDDGGSGEAETPPVEAAAPAEVPEEVSAAPQEPAVPDTPPEPAEDLRVIQVSFLHSFCVQHADTLHVAENGKAVAF